MNSDKLSERLQQVADFVPDQARLADIGSDHAYLPCYLAKNQKIAWAIAGEVVAGPYTSAKQEIEAQGLNDYVEARLGDGLEVITVADGITAITICGMGGALIGDILTAGQATGKLANRPRLILQPNVAEPQVRQWLQANHYQLTAETILVENGKFYEIMVADYAQQPELLTASEIMFGKFTKQADAEVFRQKWQSVLERLQPVITTLRDNQTNPVKLAEFLAMQQQIRAQLEDK